MERKKTYLSYLTAALALLLAAVLINIILLFSSTCFTATSNDILDDTELLKVSVTNLITDGDVDDYLIDAVSLFSSKETNQTVNLVMVFAKIMVFFHIFGFILAIVPILSFFKIRTSVMTDAKGVEEALAVKGITLPEGTDLTGLQTFNFIKQTGNSLALFFVAPVVLSALVFALNTIVAQGLDGMVSIRSGMWGLLIVNVLLVVANIVMTKKFKKAFPHVKPIKLQKPVQ